MTQQNNITLNPGTLFTPVPTECKSNLDLKINNTALPIAMYPKVLGLTLDPNFTYSIHIHNISLHAHRPLPSVKAVYKALMRPALEYASSKWWPLASSTSINKLQDMQNAALRTVTGCTQDTNIYHVYDEILILPIHEHIQLYTSQYTQKTQHPSHPIYAMMKHTTYLNTPRLKHYLQQRPLHNTHSHIPPQTPTYPHIPLHTPHYPNIPHIFHILRRPHISHISHISHRSHRPHIPHRPHRPHRSHIPHISH